MLLVVCATPLEAAPLRAAMRDLRRHEVHRIPVEDGRFGGVPARLAVCGLGRASTAFHLARLLLDPPSAVLQVGVGGAFPDGPDVGGVALATQDVYADLGILSEDGWVAAEAIGLPLLVRDDVRCFDTFACHPGATAAAGAALDAPSGPFVTLETVTGTAARALELSARHRALIESMEGAAAAHACTLDAVPFVQLRAASNLVGPRRRGEWRMELAVQAAARAAATAAASVLEAVQAG